MPKLRIGVGGSAANPPHLGHKKLVAALLAYGWFDKIIWIPSGERPDKPNFVASKHREAMTNLTFANMPSLCGGTEFIVRFDDVYNQNTPTINWFGKLEKEYPGADVVWYTGIDSVIPQKRFGGKCEIEAEWHEGKKLIRDYPFLIISREEYPRPEDLKPPSQFTVLDVNLPNISSTEIRELVKAGDNRFAHLVTPKVALYIKTNKLYGWKGGK